MKAMLEVRNIKKSYHTENNQTMALNDLSMEIFDGEFLVIEGESGCGKSTLLNVISGIDRADEGSIRYKDTEITSLNDDKLTLYRRNEVGFIFQFFNLLNDLTVFQNVTLIPSSNHDEKAVDDLLDSLGLLSKKQCYPHQLSGGEQQRVAIARAINKPGSLILCDEPTGALDYQTGKDVLRVLEKLNREQGKTIVVVSHTRDIGKMADRVLTMRDGKIINETVNSVKMDIKDIDW